MTTKKKNNNQKTKQKTPKNKQAKNLPEQSMYLLS